MKCVDTTHKNRVGYRCSIHFPSLVLKETLENRGVLGQIKARIRAEVLRALDDQEEEKPSLSNENMLINELIREYLEFNRYKYTLSVLLTGEGIFLLNYNMQQQQ